MHLLDLTLPTPAENLALDEALLETAETAAGPREALRFWEPHAPLVVVGRSSKLAAEVDQAACAARGVPVLRRPSGGAAVVAGPGCLMYALVLDCRLHGGLRAVDRAHRFVLGRLARALAALAPGVHCCGTSDLALGERKFSGNSVRCRRTHLLYHGTLLYNFPLGLIGQLLPLPPRVPDYRRGRSHADFLVNFPAPAAALRAALADAWDAHAPLAQWPRDATARLVAERYGQAAWNCLL